MTFHIHINDTDQGLYYAQLLATNYSIAAPVQPLYVFRDGEQLVISPEDSIPPNTLFRDVLLKYQDGRLVWRARPYRPNSRVDTREAAYTDAENIYGSASIQQSIEEDRS